MFGDSHWYILDWNHNPVKVHELMRWAEWMEKPFDETRKVRRTKVRGQRISTVFLGTDYNFFGGVPILFETMVFGGKHDQFQVRCSTWDEAVRQHGRVRRALNRKESPEDAFPDG